MKRKSRRAFLATVGAFSSGLAGCSTTNSNTETSPTTGTQRTTATGTAAATTAGSTTTPPEDIPTTGPPHAGVEAFENAVPEFLRQWGIPGSSVAVMKDGRLVFARGYGLADRQQETPVQPNARFRVGSISKPITAIATLRLVERGELSLDDSVFDILGQFLPDGGPADERLTETTVRQHLRHTAGWDSVEIGLGPAFAPTQIAEAEGAEPPASAETIVRFLAKQQLGADPGSRFNYANAGYIVLARVIEAVTGTNYETHVRENVLSDLGISRMRVGATQRDSRLEDEVRYYGHQTVESPYAAGEVPGPYGRFHLPSIDGAGGWVGSVTDLLRFVRGVSGGPETDNLLGTETVSRMTARPDVPSWSGERQFYGMGWYVIARSGTAPTLWHNGSLPGSYGFVIHSGSEDLTLAALFNSRSPASQQQTFNTQAQQMLIEALQEVPTWPDRDLFGRFA